MKFISLFTGNFALLLLFIAFSTLMILNPDMMTGITLEGYSNDYCQSEEAIKDPSDPLSLVCDNKYKKEKFIWIFIDGLAYDQFFKLPNDRSKYNLTNFFRISPKEYKQSGSLHESIITGKYSRNYPAKETKIDHIFRQVHLSNKALHYVGSEYPLFYLLGREHSKELFHYKLKRPECFAFDGLCPGGMNNIHNGYPHTLLPNITVNKDYLKPEITRDKLYDLLMLNYSDSQKEIKSKFDNCLKENMFEADRRDSLIYYTNRLDHLNHSFDKRHITTLFNIFSMETGIMGLIDWINLNPEYALIISSDHGGQKYNGEDDLCNHGCDEEGNEGIFFVYTKELGMDQKTLHMETQFFNVENIAPTVAQILREVNIPLEAQSSPFNLGNDNLLSYASVKSKEIQLKKFIEKFRIKYPNKKSLMQPLVDKLNSNDYSNKIKDIKSLEQMDGFFFLNYLNFIQETQNEIRKAVNQDHNSFLFSFMFYCIIFLLLLKIFVELKQMRNIISMQINQKVNKGLFASIIFALAFEVMITFFFARHKFDYGIYISRLIEGFILFSIGFCYNMLFGFDRRFFICALFASYSIWSSLMVYWDAFPKLRRFFSQEGNQSLVLNACVNYPLALGYLIIEIKALKKMYVDSKLRIQLAYILYAVSIFMLSIMVCFDKDIPQHFESHTANRSRFVKIIYNMIIGSFILSFWKVWKKIPFDPKTKEPTSTIKVKFQALAKFPMFFYAFFISDETERLLMFIGFFPAYYLLIPQIKKTKNMYWKLICSIFLLMIPDILYLVTKNTFSFDISLRVTNKCTGYAADDTPITTGILMGTHKLKFYMLSAAYLVGAAPVSKTHFLKNESFMLRMAIDIQLILMICLYFFFLVKGYEEHYLQVFIWIMTKCMVCLIFDIIIFLWYFVLHLRRKPVLEDDLVAPGQTVEQVIEMEETADKEE